MALAIHLLGKPRVEQDGVLVGGLKGRKPWALLAYLLGCGRPVPREQLAALLFTAADDPLGALRWNLVQLRRLLGDSRILRGDPLRIVLPPDSFIDVRALMSGTWMEAVDLPGLGSDLLAGMDFPASPGFETWLLSERQRVKATAHATLREAVTAKLAEGHTSAAISLAVRLVALDPLAEDHQALLIRSYTAAGDHEAARRQLAACAEVFRRELGAQPSPAIRSAMRATTVSPAHHLDRAARAQVQLEAGEAALAAGMLNAGLGALRQAITVAERSGRDHVKVRALVALGSALAHAGRRRDPEATAVLRQAIALSERTGQSAMAAAAYRELAWTELMAAQYGAAQHLISQAASLVGQDSAERAAILLIQGISLTDLGRYAESTRLLRESVTLASASGDGKRHMYCLSWLGRAQLLRGEIMAARQTLEHAIACARSVGWIWPTALPESFLGEAQIQEGNLSAALQTLEHALATACQVGDFCFQSLSARSMGLLEAAHGNADTAGKWLAQARLHAVAAPDYTWSAAYALDALCTVAVRCDPGAASRWINDLQTLASRTGMREFVARAYHHRASLGEEDALKIARHLAAEIDNPTLHELLASPVHY